MQRCQWSEWTSCNPIVTTDRQWPVTHRHDLQTAVMVASRDLHQQPQAQHSPHTSPWGTWEELLLASAVQRYGQDDWPLISAQLQSRIKGSFTFTPEACRRKYEAIKLRFGFAGTREESDDTVWFEELRKLRVAQLKRELEQYDSSIGSLERKIRKLRSERAESNSQKSLSVEVGASELEGAYDTRKAGSKVVSIETDVSGCRTNLGFRKKVPVKIKENAKGKTRVPATRTHSKAGANMSSSASQAFDKRVRVLAEASGKIQAKTDFESGKTECSVSSVPNAFKTKLSSSSEWEDSTNRKHQHAIAAKNLFQDDSASKEDLASKNVSHELLVGRVKVEALTTEDVMSEPSVCKMDGGMQTLASRELAFTNPQPRKPDVRVHGANSCKNLPPCEVWGESLEEVVTHTELVKNNFAEGSTPKLSLSVIEGPDKKRDSSVSLTPAEVSVKAESVSIHNEVINSVQTSESPGGNDDSMEAWHHLERLSGDSNMEKSELGSHVNINEDVSPASKTNREPKVCGMLLPLLVSLRNVSAHRCAPLFKHQRENQNNRRYHLMIRAPMDLGLVRTKLEEGDYCGSLDFFRDLLLMVTNALVYYSKDSSESAVAFGLRECIMKEMESILKTELLVKQGGPTFRKRDSGKARQKSPVKRVGAQISLPSVVDKSLKEVACMRCDAIMNVGGTDGRSIAKGPAGEGATMTDEKDESSLDFKRLLDSEPIKPKSVASRKVFEDTKELLVDEDCKKTSAGTTGVSSSTKGPLKRGVGRPPKHVHDQDPQKAKEASVSPRKRPKR